MRLLIRSKRDVRVVTLVITLGCMAVSEMVIGGLFLFGGADAFRLENAVLFAFIIPILLAVPITYYIAGQSRILFEAKQELQRLADTDSLTGLPNRRSFFSDANELLERAAAANVPCTLLVLDADYFKSLNDSYGHAVGDRALVAIAEVLKENFRQSDLLCRVGGEEFAVMLAEMDAAAAQPLAQRVVDAVANSPLTEERTIIEYSVSCGLADTTSTYDLPQLFKTADDAMYQAKDRGRNQVALTDVAA